MTYSLKNKIRISIISFDVLNKTLCQLLRFLFKFENINLPPDTLYITSIFRVTKRAGTTCRCNIPDCAELFGLHALTHHLVLRNVPEKSKAM